MIVTIAVVPQGQRHAASTSPDVLKVIAGPFDQHHRARRTPPPSPASECNDLASDRLGPLLHDRYRLIIDPSTEHTQSLSAISVQSVELRNRNIIDHVLLISFPPIPEKAGSTNSSRRTLRKILSESITASNSNNCAASDLDPSASSSIGPRSRKLDSSATLSITICLTADSPTAL
jgi:hypothetical protein